MTLVSCPPSELCIFAELCFDENPTHSFLLLSILSQRLLKMIHLYEGLFCPSALFPYIFSSLPLSSFLQHPSQLFHGQLNLFIFLLIPSALYLCCWTLCDTIFLTLHPGVILQNLCRLVFPKFHHLLTLQYWWTGSSCRTPIFFSSFILASIKALLLTFSFSILFISFHLQSLFSLNRKFLSSWCWAWNQIYLFPFSPSTLRAISQASSPLQLFFYFVNSSFSLLPSFIGWFLLFFLQFSPLSWGSIRLSSAFWLFLRWCFSDRDFHWLPVVWVFSYSNFTSSFLIALWWLHDIF